MQQERDRNRIDIRRFLSRYSGQEVLYCPNPGNGGDAFISHAAYRLFEELSIGYEVLLHEQRAEGRTILYGGGGNLIEGRYPHAHHFLANNIGRGNSIVVLPHTVRGYGEFLAEASDVTVICRETVSYDALRESGMPADRLLLGEDLAFTIDPADFAEIRKGEGTGLFLRVDVESAGKMPIPQGNIDISMCWNGDLWDDPEFTAAVCRSIVLYINRFETVVTDRLHVGIMAALYGKKVILHPNDYYKVRAVYLHSLERYRNVTFMDDVDSDASPVRNGIVAADPLPEAIEGVEPHLETPQMHGPDFIQRLGSRMKQWFSP